MKKVLSERKSHSYGIVPMVLERLRDYFYERKSFEAVCLMSYGRVVYMAMVIVVVCFWVTVNMSWISVNSLMICR